MGMPRPCRVAALAVTLLSSLPLAAPANPAARPSRDASAYAGRWNGAHLEQRSQCTTAANNGFHGTYAEYIVRVDAAARTMTLDEIAVTGLTCNYSGPYREEAGRLSWSGGLSCSDNRSGTFESQSLFALGTIVSLRLAIRLNSAERCVIDALLGGSRL